MKPLNLSDSPWSGDRWNSSEHFLLGRSCTIFWDRQGVLFVDFLPQGCTINTDMYCKTLKKLHHTIQKKRHDHAYSGHCVDSWQSPPTHFSTTAQHFSAIQHLLLTFGSEQFLLTAKISYCIMRSCMWNPCLLASGSTMTMRSNKPLTCCLHHTWHLSIMKGGYNSGLQLWHVPQQQMKLCQKVV